jgi:hypothetical protein
VGGAVRDMLWAAVSPMSEYRRCLSTTFLPFVHRLGYFVGYSARAPKLRYVHGVRFGWS